MTEKLLSLSIGTTPIEAPKQIPVGGLSKAYSSGSSILLLIFILGTVLALAYLIYGGVKWITSGGDKAKVQSARNTIVFSVVGLIVIFLSYFIINVLTHIFNVPSVTTLPKI